MNLREFEQNRAILLKSEWAKYEGKWVAFSPDGKRVLASSAELGELDALILEVGENPEQAPLEFIVGEDDYCWGSGDLF